MKEPEPAKKIEVSGTLEELPWNLIIAAALGGTVVVNVIKTPKSSQIDSLVEEPKEE